MGGPPMPLLGERGSMCIDIIAGEMATWGTLGGGVTFARVLYGPNHPAAVGGVAGRGAVGTRVGGGREAGGPRGR